ncbi:MAG: bifunctional UDP-N-acetylglucosamine diphosphorylase/glucosamine-1-phosphate N-acetyltransferase GlmU [Rhodospirillaceae bacterium]|nr:bifunctional UDP-N-acetylglucosamine diphosphorylase/glucosamine-1-phosphate N-acetyltransferase GlmU [Rhodospirillaceae bacterium]
MADRRATACVVLAAGKGTRMVSDIPKVLHRLAGRTLLGHVLAAVGELAPQRTVVVVSPDMAELPKLAPGADIAVQPDRRGTGDAVRRAAAHLEGFAGTVVVVFGDTPLVTAATLGRLAGCIDADTAVAVFGMRPDDAGRYGRLVVDTASRLERIVEFADASAAERAIALCNGGFMAFDSARLPDLLDALQDTNAQGEFYLTDTVAAARARGWGCAVVEGDAVEALGVNTRGDLALVGRHHQDRLRTAALAAGVTLVDPATTYLSADTTFGRDVVIEPMVVIGPGVALGDRAHVLSFSHLEGAAVDADVSVGPFARLRPGAHLADGAKVGNFVEVKNAEVGAGAKVSHLSYIGDADIGARANIGAGTITCNYDGFLKYRTTVGEDAFIGSNTALVAPVTVGDRAMVGAGSTIARPVAADAMAMTRAPQTEREGWAAKFRRVMSGEKARRAARKAGNGN